MNLSDHFTLEELTKTEHRQYAEMNADPPESVIENLHVLAEFLEQIRELLGHPITINSGYRCLPLNRALGSKDTSQHLTGEAADFTCPGFGSPREIVEKIRDSGIKFDQCILEYGRWVHISFSPRMRQAILTIDQNGTRMGIA